VNLIINIGNTRTKLGVFSSRKLKDTAVFSNHSVNKICSFIKKVEATDCMVSATTNIPKKILEQLTNPLFVDEQLALPFTVDYDSKNTLGDDRLSAVAGARQLKKNSDLLVITAGTCITYNIFTAANVFLGGSISPGVQMRYNAMHQMTGKLPLAPNNEFDELIGRSTIECLQSGVRKGIVAEMDGIISQYQLLYPTIQVFICGGSASFFERRTKNKIFAHPNLELIGMNELLMYNRTI